MCELLGISANRPLESADVLEEFRRRGGALADNPDGWGIAHLQEGSFRIRKEPSAGARSALFAQACRDVRSELVIVHVRKARWPRVNAFANTHPFKQSCCGIEWVFAHNGMVPDVIGADLGDGTPFCRPAGETDSEHAFCHVLHRVARSFGAGAAPGTEPWLRALAAVSESIARHGRFNFLLSNGAYLIAYGHDRLHYAERAGTVFIATEPLRSVEGWEPFEARELRIYHRGELIADFDTREAGEMALA